MTIKRIPVLLSGLLSFGMVGQCFADELRIVDQSGTTRLVAEIGQRERANIEVSTKLLASMTGQQLPARIQLIEISNAKSAQGADVVAGDSAVIHNIAPGKYKLTVSRQEVAISNVQLVDEKDEQRARDDINGTAVGGSAAALSLGGVTAGALTTGGTTAAAGGVAAASAGAVAGSGAVLGSTAGGSAVAAGAASTVGSTVAAVAPVASAALSAAPSYPRPVAAPRLIPNIRAPRLPTTPGGFAPGGEVVNDFPPLVPTALPAPALSGS